MGNGSKCLNIFSWVFLLLFVCVWVSMGLFFSQSREYAWPSWQLTHGNPSRQLNCLSLRGSYAMKCHEVPIFPIHSKGSICIYIIYIYSDQCAKQCQNVHSRFSLLILLQEFIILLHICIPVSLLVYISICGYVNIDTDIRHIYICII